jgi:hypothetical protein
MAKESLEAGGQPRAFLSYGTPMGASGLAYGLILAQLACNLIP